MRVRSSAACETALACPTATPANDLGVERLTPRSTSCSLQAASVITKPRQITIFNVFISLPATMYTTRVYNQYLSIRSIGVSTIILKREKYWRFRTLQAFAVNNVPAITPVKTFLGPALFQPGACDSEENEQQTGNSSSMMIEYLPVQTINS